MLGYPKGLQDRLPRGALDGAELEFTRGISIEEKLDESITESTQTIIKDD
jgi:hypothetical protein